MPAELMSHRGRLEYELWQAIVEMETGKRRTAVQRASRLVADAQSEGHVRLFLDAGPPAERLLRVLDKVAPTPYVHQLVQMASNDAIVSTHPSGLSDRELEVVRYLPTPLSSEEIAAQLFISLNTLKTHLRRIYRKLDAQGRKEAARQAELLGLA